MEGVNSYHWPLESVPHEYFEENREATIRTYIQKRFMARRRKHISHALDVYYAGLGTDIVTVHDLGPWLNGTESSWDRFWRKAVFPSLHQALLVGVGPQSRIDAEEMGFNVPEIVPPALQDAFKMPYVGEKRGGEWLLVGDNPRKRADLALEAVPEGSGIIWIVGGPWPAWRWEVARIASGRDQHLSFKLRPTTMELVALYRNAKGLIVASDHEGFCLPIIEALSQDCPVYIQTKKPWVRNTYGTATETMATEPREAFARINDRYRLTNVQRFREAWNQLYGSIRSRRVEG